MSSLNIRTMILILATGLAAGCQSWPLKDIGMTRYAGNSYLEEGVQNYEEGNYRVAKRRLQFALEEGLSRPDRVKAHKYLAFIACVSSQQLACREQFAIPLELDPDFELPPPTPGHPLCVPMFTNS